MDENSSIFRRFKTDVSKINLPENFTFPFYYFPHQLCEIAAKEVQSHLEIQLDWDHDFGLGEKPGSNALGKMFGVLLVRNKEKKLGYLAAFSGKLANQYKLPGFVPPLFNFLEEGSFFKIAEKEIENFTAKIETLESSQELREIQKTLLELSKQEEEILDVIKKTNKANKKERQERRLNLTENHDVELLNLSMASQADHFHLKDTHRKFKKERERITSEQLVILTKIKNLKTQRAELSAKTQKELFTHYTFLNSGGELKSVESIFTDVPPSGAGDCAAPKLLQYAFENEFEPLAMAEFWWGQAPPGEVRKHRQYYPSCKSKCEPILGHMLAGITLDPSPLLHRIQEVKSLEIIFEDDDLIVVNKPSDLLSVPGKEITDSVLTRVGEKFATDEQPLTVHRLDMSTSGILLLAKNKEAHKHLQAQFIERTVQKRYVALLEGEIAEDEGFVELPLRVDIDDRPRQMVCHEHGKPAKTRWKKIAFENGNTRVYFFPITGRTHQLRVHSAHQKGLGTPIVGDELYGKQGKRLCLHAEFIKIIHPKTLKKMTFQLEADF